MLFAFVKIASMREKRIGAYQRTLTRWVIAFHGWKEA